jgi:hypothetical protein
MLCLRRKYISPCLVRRFNTLTTAIEPSDATGTLPSNGDEHCNVGPAEPSTENAQTKGNSSYCHPADAQRELVDMGDAPSCHVCGAICTRSGACFTCLPCGSSTSCG